MIELGPDDGILILTLLRTPEEALWWRSMFDEYLPNLPVLFLNSDRQDMELIIVRGAK